jgi:adenylate cyclase, class 2
MAGARRQIALETRMETEVKLACNDLGRLRNAGLELVLTEPRHFEDNWLLDTRDQTLLKSGSALRVRILDGKGLVTFKGVVKENGGSPLKVREEIESETAEPHVIIELLERLGYFRTFRYQKYRTVYSIAVDEDTVEVAVDETPMGDFIEIEGNEPAVLRVMELAQFTERDVIQPSYPELQALRCSNEGRPLEDLVFSSDLR